MQEPRRYIGGETRAQYTVAATDCDMAPNPAAGHSDSGRFKCHAIADSDIGGSTGRQLHQRLGRLAAKADPRFEPFCRHNLVVNEPQRVDRKRDKQHVNIPFGRAVELKDERGVIGQRPPEHQPAGLLEKRVGDLDVAGK